MEIRAGADGSRLERFILMRISFQKESNSPDNRVISTNLLSVSISCIEVIVYNDVLRDLCNDSVITSKHRFNGLFNVEYFLLVINNTYYYYYY